MFLKPVLFLPYSPRFSILLASGSQSLFGEPLRVPGNLFGKKKFSGKNYFLFCASMYFFMYFLMYFYVLF